MPSTSLRITITSAMIPEAAALARFTSLFQYSDWRSLVHKGSDSQGKLTQMQRSGPDNYSLKTAL